jgi:hypothetical protein
MPISYDFYDKANFIHARLTGAVTAEEFLRFDEETRRHPRIRSGFTELLDASSAVPSGPFEEALDLIRERDRQYPDQCRGSRTAIVVPDTEASELAKRFEQDSAHRTVIVFYNIDVAKTWLGFDALVGGEAPVPVADPENE